MEAWYLKEQLAKYKSGIRGSVQDSLASQKMHLATQNLNDEDIKFLAHLYAEKESQKSQPLITGDFNYGKNLYQKNCYACHEGAMGKFFTGSPSLNTLPDWYIVNQFNNFYQKKRGTHPKDPKGLRMAARVNTIKIDDIKHIAHYLHSRQ
jgi:cytochrome c553